MAGKQQWPDADIRQVERMYAAGERISDIASSVGRTHAAVNSLLCRSGFRDKHATKRNSVDGKKQARDSSIRINELEKALEQTQLQLDAARQKKLVLPTGAKRKKAGKSYCRVMAGDFHGTAVNREALAALLRDLEIIQPAEFVWGGDIIDCGGFLAQHHTLGYVADTEYCYSDDLEVGNEILDSVASRLAKGATQRFIEGNHEARVEKWIVDQVHNNKDAQKLREVWGPDIQLNLDKRGISFHSQGEFHDDIGNRGTIRLGKVLAVHGANHAKNATEKHAIAFGTNTVHFHTHRADYHVMRTVAHGLYAAWCPGCMCIRQPRWKHSTPTGWNEGYWLQVVNPDETFLGINIPIDGNRSYLEPLAATLGAA